MSRLLVVFITFGVLLYDQSLAQENWLDSVEFNADLRLRSESIDDDKKEFRHRGRFRTRLGLTAKVNNNVQTIFRLASGGGNPVSTNQSFDDGFSIKDIRLDLAYVDWALNDTTHIYGGKMKNPLYRAGSHPLIWDSDLSPEGLAVIHKKGRFFGTLATLVVEERSSSDNSFLVALQGGININIFDRGDFTGGIGYFDYSATIGNQPFYNGQAKGNSVAIDCSMLATGAIRVTSQLAPFCNPAIPEGNLIFDYNELEFFGQFDTTIGNFPLSIFVNLVQNSGASINNNGYAFGAKVGKAKTPGDWQASWAWQNLKADAVIATFTDSDFGGGGTDAKGHTLKSKYVLANNWALAGTLFLNEIDISSDNRHDYSRLQLDLEFKF